MTRRELIAFCALLLLGCLDAAPDPLTVEVRDSSGIRRVTSPDIAPCEWTIDSVPMVDIGAATGESEQQLATPWASLRMPDGRIAISNAGTNELRL